MWTFLLAFAVRPGPHVELSLSERRRLEAELRAAIEALNDAPLGPEAPAHRDEAFSAQLALGWEDEAAAQTRMLLATTAPEAAWTRANSAEDRARADALAEAELRMLARAWHQRADALTYDRERSEQMLAETCALYDSRYADNPRAAQLADICPTEAP